MADEIDKGQAAGEVATREEHPDGLVRNPDKPPATFADLGVTRQRVAEWRQTRDAGEGVTRAVWCHILRLMAPRQDAKRLPVREIFGLFG